MGSRNKQAGPGAGVDIALSGKTKDGHRVDGDIDWDGEFKVNPNDFTQARGQSVVSDVTMFSYYDSVRVRGKAGYISDIRFEDTEIKDWEETFKDWEQVPKTMTFRIAELENVMLSGGWSRSKAPKGFDMKGYGELEVDFEDGGYEYFGDVFFEGHMKTTKDFQRAWDMLDEPTDEDSYDDRPKVVASVQEKALRREVIKLAHENPSLRSHLLPLLK